MPNTEMTNTGEGTDTDWTLAAGADKWTATKKPQDDATNITETTDQEMQSLTSGNMPTLASLIVSVNVDSRGRRAGGSTASGFNTFMRIAGNVTHDPDDHVPGAVYVNYSDDGFARPGGGTWTRADVDASMCGVRLNLNAGTGMNIFTVQTNVDWLPVTGGWNWLCGFWLPTLWPLVGAAVKYSELVSHFAQTKFKEYRPSLEEDFRRIEEWLQVRRVTLALR
jgi:hypothetical protein